jgi:hypothetical protein
MSRTPSKADLMKWADERVEVDLECKVILQKLAAYASEDGDTWSKVETLAYHANCSVRTIQLRLKWLKENGYLRDTGRTHRLKDSTRSVPLYVLQPTLEAELEPVSMGANSAPIDRAWVQNSEGMGATGCAPKDTRDTSESSDELSTRARALDEWFEQLEAAYPRIGLGFTDRTMARRAFTDLVASGVDPAALVAAAAAYRDDPIVKRRDYGPVALQRWLGEARYRAWLPGPAPEVAAIRPEPAGPQCAVPPRVVAKLTAASSDAAKWLLGSDWREGDQAILVRTETAAVELRRAVGDRLLTKLQIKIERAMVSDKGVSA